MDTLTKAKKAAILMLMHGYPSSQDRITSGTVDAYLAAVEACSADAVERSCKQFLAGKVESHNNAFLPTAAELAANAATWDRAIAFLDADRAIDKAKLVRYPMGEKPPPPLVPLGPIKAAFGNGPEIDMTNMSHAEKEAILTSGKVPDAAEDAKRVEAPKLKRMQQ